MKVFKRLSSYFKNKHSDTKKSDWTARAATGYRYCQPVNVIQYSRWPVTHTITAQAFWAYPVVPVSPTYYLPPGTGIIFSNGQSVQNCSNTPVYTSQVAAYSPQALQRFNSHVRQGGHSQHSTPKPPPLKTSQQHANPTSGTSHANRIVRLGNTPSVVTLPKISKEEQDFIDIMNDYVALHNQQDENIDHNNLLEYINLPTSKEYNQNIGFILKLKSTLSKYKKAIQSSAMENYYYDKICKDLIKKFEPEKFAA